MNPESCVTLKGKKVDGFFEAIFAKHTDSKKFDEKLTYERLREICESSVKEYNPKGRFTGKMTAFSSHKDVFDYPIFLKNNASSGQIKRVVIFGDSLSDTGNILNWLKVFPQAPYWQGRFTDGLNWVGALPSNIPVSNWAYGGATAGYYFTEMPTALELAKKLKQAAAVPGRAIVTGDMLTNIEKYINQWVEGKMLQPHVVKDTLFVLWAGANDYFSKFDSEHDIAEILDFPDSVNVKGSSADRRNIATNAIITSMSKLYDAGARHFLVPNLPDFGILPVVSQLPDDVQYRAEDIRSGNMTKEEVILMASEKVSEIVEKHNRALKSKIEAFKSERGDAEVIYLDAGALLTKVFEGDNLEVAGISREFSSKLKTKRGIPFQKKCYNGWYLGLSSPADYDKMVTTKAGDSVPNVCADPTQAMFFDDVHPTSKTHCIIGNVFLDTLMRKGWVVDDVTHRSEREFTDILRDCAQSAKTQIFGR